MLDASVIEPCEYTKCQQNGIDLTLVEDLILEPHGFKNILLNERIKLPQGVCAVLKIRSTYSRQGIFLSSGLYDSGFVGNLGCTLYNFSERRIVIGANERICQVVCYAAESASIYNGQYQNT